MIYLSIPIEVLTGPVFIGAEPVDRATWLCLLRFCAQQENGGVIAGCAGWGDRRWMQLAAVTRHEVQRECALWSWDGGDVRVAFYPLEKELELRAKRTAGAAGGAARTEAKQAAARANGAAGGRPRQTQAETQAGTEAETEAPGPGTEAKTQGSVLECRGETPLTPLAGVRIPETPEAVAEGDEAAAQVYGTVYAALRRRNVGPAMLPAVEQALATARAAGVPSERQAELLLWLQEHHGQKGVPRLPGPEEMVRVNGGLAAWFDRVGDARERCRGEPKRSGMLQGTAEMRYRDGGGKF